jgi:signal transduction histidine kinase
MFFDRIREFPTSLSIRVRLTLLFSLVLAGSLVFFSFLLYDSFKTSHGREFDVALFNHAVDISEDLDLKAVNKHLRIEDETEEGEPEKIFPFAVSRSYMQILTTEGRVIATSGQPSWKSLPFGDDDRLRLNSGADSSYRTLEKPGTSEIYRLINFPLDDSEKPQLILQIAAPMDLQERQEKNLRDFFLFSIPLIIALAAMGGYYLAGRALAPVTRLIEKANALKADRLSERLPVPRVKDEMFDLIGTLNDLLDRLEGAFRSQERFIADASHQLLTPLAILRGELDTVKDRDHKDIRKFLDSASHEVDRLSKLVRDMLILAKVDAGTSSLMIMQVDFSEILFEELTRFQQMAATKGIAVRVNISSEPLLLQGDGGLLKVLIQNLIENAIKYSPENSLIEIESIGSSGALVFSVKDTGPGIVESEASKVFERFYRSPGTRKSVPGTGLGLAIAQKIAEAHKGTLSVQSKMGEGSKFTFALRLD